MPGLLVIDDDPSIPLVVRQAVTDPGVDVSSACTAQAGCDLVARQRPDVVILDALIPDQSGLAVIERIHRVDAKIPVIFVAARVTSHTAIEAMRQGAYEFLVKPLDVAQLRQIVGRALEIRRLTYVSIEVRETAELTGNGTDALIGRSPEMQQVYKAIGQVAEQDVSVLITGETGTGKELVARTIHDYSRRSAQPFISINCSTSDEPALERELFGDRTSPRSSTTRPGQFEQARGGTLLLDEISDLPAGLQSKVLQYLQKQTCQRSGGDPKTTGVRLIATTSRYLESLVAAGQFRPDLFYHLSGFLIAIPPLRSRLDDIPALARHLLMQFNRELGKRVYRLSPESLAILSAYHWPGNVRELESMLRQALVRATGAVLLPEFLPGSITGSPVLLKATSDETVATTDWTAWLDDRFAAHSTEIYAEAQALMDRHVLTRVLQHTGGNQAQAARLLGMTRASLRSRIRGLGIVIDRLVDVYDDSA